MATQSEIEMEKALVAQLQELGYNSLGVTTERQMVENFRKQVEAHNQIVLSNDEFAQLLEKLNKGDIIERARILRGKVDVIGADGLPKYLELFSVKHWCQNRFQVCRQITNRSAENHSRYDVTLLINGLPLVQIELKARGSDLRSAFDQIVRYRGTSYHSNSGLFGFIQLFVISNGVDTRYFSNNTKLNFQFTFEWADKDNRRINRLPAFAEAFLEKCHLSKMIARYIVVHDTFQALMVLRPYQYYAVEKILERVGFGRGDGYVWHTTGSGKTLTSFKASQILSNDPKIDKVIFVVDRRDLDYQTALEFNAFSAGSVDATENTKKLVEQLLDPGCKLIVTTIQKLNAAISREQFKNQCKEVAGKKVVFIFDECHRSQFGETHQRICDFFSNRQMFGFTGTPIFDANVVKTKYGNKTTEDLFGEALHKYVITDAIRDRNVLRFSVEYRDLIKPKDTVTLDDGTKVPAQALTDEQMQQKPFLESPSRVSGIVSDILMLHPVKTYECEYTAMFCVSSVDLLQSYYLAFARAKDEGQHDLRIATIFSCAPGEPEEFSGLTEQDLPDMGSSNIDQGRMAFLKGCVADYNAMYATSYDPSDNKSFYEYYQDLARRVKRREVDVLLVVNMFLTGFDSPPLNTLYVDKNLRHHGLIQAYSRTNRLLDAKKSHGNIVCYRRLKNATDEALSIFANRDAAASVDEVIGTVIMQPYPDLKETFKQEVEKLREIAKSPDAVDDLLKEEDQYDFLAKFRDVLRIQNTLKTFNEFRLEIETGSLGIDEQELLDYQSKYLDKRELIEAAAREERRKKRQEGGDQNTGEDDPGDAIQPLLFDFDFAVDLIKRDEVTVSYILGLIEKLPQQKGPKQFEQLREMILNVLESDPDLRHKRALFKDFIDVQLPLLSTEASTDVESSILKRFNAFVIARRTETIDQFCEQMQIERTGFQALYEDFIYRERLPDISSLLALLKVRPKITERKATAETMRDRLVDLAKEFEGAEVDLLRHG
ncbi:MAG: type I restriction endonuclease subunit R [Pseudohongiella sp.]|nr:type I restriction endonuclease subunit R [Pseudohongiella sp.]